MFIGVLSDTHDRLDSIQKAIEIFKDRKVSEIVHCGDWVSPFTLEFFDVTCGDFQVPIKSVFGNNEGDIKRIVERNEKLRNPIEFTSKQTLELIYDGKKIAVYHGQDKVLLKALIQSQLYDVIFTGHTHTPLIKTEKKTLLVNPGSTSYTANSHIIKTASIAIWDSSHNIAQIVYLD